MGVAADFPTLCRLAGLPEPEPERPVVPGRRWRWDWCWPQYKLAVEIDGGVYTRGRHTRGKGYEADLEKYAAGLIEGWTVLRVSTGQVRKGLAVAWLLRLFERRGLL